MGDPRADASYFPSSWSMYSLSHPAWSRFPLMPSLHVLSCRSRLRAMRLRSEKFCAALPARLRSRSSPKLTSRAQWSLFSMPQW